MRVLLVGLCTTAACGCRHRPERRAPVVMQGAHVLTAAFMQLCELVERQHYKQHSGFVLEMLCLHRPGRHVPVVMQ